MTFNVQTAHEIKICDAGHLKLTQFVPVKHMSN